MTRLDSLVRDLRECDETPTTILVLLRELASEVNHLEARIIALEADR